MSDLERVKSFEKPTGFRDYPPHLAHKKRTLEQRLQQKFASWGYQEIITPTLEFYDTIGHASSIAEPKLFKCMDRTGNTLVLRPDHTAPIARVVSSLLKEERLPIRLGYHANVFRAQEHEAGRNAEFYQSGLELIGLSGAEADAEVIALSIECLQACEIMPFQLPIGHMGLLNAWLEERVQEKTQVEQLKHCLYQRNRVGFLKAIKNLPIGLGDKEELSALVQIETQPFSYYHTKARSEIVQKALQHLEEIWSHLDDFGLLSFVVFDPSMTGETHYYTGITFEAYSAQSGFPLLSGGRYDDLLGQFEYPLPATGFALYTERLMEVSPLEINQPTTVGIYYSKNQQKKAFRKASELRQAGKVVYLHMNQTAHTDQYDERVVLGGEGLNE